MDIVSQFEARLFPGPIDLPYRLHLPPGLSAKSTWPLIVFLHGAGERGHDNESQLRYGVSRFVSPAADNPGALVMVPQCPLVDPEGREMSWLGPWETRFQPVASQSQILISVMQVVDVLATEYPVDMDRLYIAGISMGAFAIWYLLSSLPDIFAGAIAVCGGGQPEFASKIKHVPIWAFHGARDNVVPVRWSRDIIQALRADGGTPRYTEYPDVGHDAWTPAFAEADLLQWLFQQRRG